MTFNEVVDQWLSGENSAEAVLVRQWVFELSLCPEKERQQLAAKISKAKYKLACLRAYDIIACNYTAGGI